MASSSDDTSLLCFIPQHIRDLIARSDAQEPPWVDVSEFGITAIIDISGYSKLTSHLQSFYGNDGGAKVKELLNPPIIEIIKRVKDGFGSVVKFSGDAIIASWTSKESLTLIEKELLTTRALLCCLELTSFFSDYNIMVPVQKELMSSFSISPALPSPKVGPMTLNRMSVSAKRTSTVVPQAPGVSRRMSMQYPSLAPQITLPATPLTPSPKRRTSGNVNALQIPNRDSIVGRVMSSHSANKKGSVDGVTEQETRKPQQLKIHIGLGFGKTSHIHVGERYDIDNTTSDPRMEYFIAGESMKNAAEFLSIGTEGDIVFSSELISFLNPEIQEEVLKKSEHKMRNGLKYRLISSVSEEVFELINPLTARAQALNTTDLKRFGLSVSQLLIPESLPWISRCKAFLDDGIKRVISNATDRRISNANCNPALSLSANLASVFESYDQLRNVSVVFLKMPQFDPETLQEPTNLDLLQQATKIVLQALRKFEGCLRQFNCDDKGVTALMVWGLDGFSHEKGEAPLAIGAALRMVAPLKKLFGTKFSIGISTGTVFSGIVGNSKRCDGTILGVCVNNAARFMCLPMCDGTIICDEDTYNGSKAEYTFKVDYDRVMIKGINEPVAIYTPTKKTRGTSIKRTEDDFHLVGRDLEKSRIQNIMASWKSGYPESILLTGRSGVGKSALRNFCELQIINERNIFICTGQSLEHQQKAPLYIFGEILRELAHHIKHRINLKEVTPSTSKRGSKYSQSISGNSAMRSNRSSMLKPHGEGQDRRKSTALSILESAQSLSSHRGSFTFSGLFGPTTESPPAVPTPPSVASPSMPTSIRQSSNIRHLSMDNQNQNRRRSLVQDITNILMGRRSTVDNSRVSGVLPEAPPALPTRSKTESATKQSGDSFMKKSSSQLKSVDTSYSQSNSKLLIRNPNYLAPNTSGSILAKSNESYPLKSSKSSVIDHSMLGLYLQSMGEPQSSIELLKFIPGVLDASDNNTQMAADIIPRISGVVSNILDSLASFGIKIAFIFDDLQWCDSHSYDLLTSLMRKCPSIMFILSCRPAEEWSKMYLDRFFALSGLSKHKIPIAPFRYEAIDELIRYKFRNIMAHTDTVSNALVKDVLERSQGIALVTNIFVNMLLEESLLKVENGVLTYANEHSAIELPNEAMGAIVSQFDKLSVPMKIVLRLAAMCGQYFDTQELSQVIESSNLKQTLTTIDCDPIKLYNHIINSDKYRFIKRGDSPNTLAFTHYLIQQGILSTVIPSKREEMHEMLANYYESKLNDDKASDRKYYYTEVLIFHLMQIAGQYERKQTVILKAFVESATMFRSSEALEYYDLLLSIRKDGQGLTQLTQLQESKENRLLGQIYYELGDRQTAINHYYQSLANLGHIVPKSFFRKLLSTFHFTQTIKKFINSPTDQQQTISLQLLCTEFPVLAAALQRQNTSQTLTETLFSEVSTSISGIIRILAVNKTSLEYALFNTFAICLMGCDQTDWKLRYCLTYLLTSQTKLPLRFLHETLNESLAALSDILYTQVLDEYKVEQMTSPQTVMYSELVRCKAVLSRARGDWRVALDGFQDFEEIKVVIGLGTSEDAFWSRSKVVEMLTLLGEFSGADYDREQTLKWYNNNNCDTYMQSTYLIQQAVIQCSLGCIEDATKTYLENAIIPGHTTDDPSGKIETMDEMEQYILFHTCCLTICISIMHYAFRKDDLFIWRNRAETHCLRILKKFRKMPGANVGQQGALVWMILSALMDWFIFEDGSSAKPENKLRKGDPEYELIRFFIGAMRKKMPPLFTHLNCLCKALVYLRSGKRLHFCAEIDRIVEAAKDKPFITEYHSILILTYKWMIAIQMTPGSDPAREADAQAYASYFESMDYKFRCDVIERRLLKCLQTSMRSTPSKTG